MSSTRKKFLFYLAIIVGGALLGGFSGYLAAQGRQFIMPELYSRKVLALITYVAFWLMAPVTVYLLYRTNQYHKEYQQAEDEEESYPTYRQTFRMLGYGTILQNILQALALFTIFTAVVPFSVEKGFELENHEWPIVLVAVFIQVYLLKTTQKVRNYKLSAFPTINEMQKFSFSYDEGELQANYEQSYRVLFSLNQRFIPALYFILALISLITTFDTLSGFLVLTVIAIYINLMQYPMVNKYYR